MGVNNQTKSSGPSKSPINESRKTAFQAMYEIAVTSIFFTFLNYIVTNISNFVLSCFSLVIVKNEPLSYPKEIKEPQSKTMSTTTTTTKSTERKNASSFLFPPINLSTEPSPESSESSTPKEEKIDDSLTPISCSMGLTTRLLPIKNSKGELEWVFAEDDNVMNNKENDLDAFKHPPPVILHKVAKEENEVHANELSPTMSNSSNETTLSQKLGICNKEHSISPNNSFSPFEEEDEEEQSTSDCGKKSSFPCPHCDAVFSVRGYLTRHLKKHSSNKAYTCPYFEKSTYTDDNNITHKCHPTGGFSRRDTYKTHLKSRHFKYPEGTKTRDRATSPGNCSMCGEFFSNAEMWCEIHVEGGECKQLPFDHKGKSRIKNKLRKKLQKNEVITDPELLPFALKVYEEVKEQKKLKKLARQQKKCQTLYNHTQNYNGHRNFNLNPHSLQQPSPQHADTPDSMGSSIYEVSSVHSPYTPQSSMSKSPLSLMNNHYPKQTQLQPTMANQSQHNNAATTTNTSVKCSTSNVTIPPYQYDQVDQQIKQTNQDDYDDEYCLDIDQLNSPTLKSIIETLKLPQQYLFPKQCNAAFSKKQPSHTLQQSSQEIQYSSRYLECTQYSPYLSYPPQLQKENSHSH
ncbi:STP2 [Candida oxycetoniae]|uniref:STP2 n=1 Tax=Candida oxycetoniae TaxID=497107 RepID=A0AAI9T0N3_9ASCO|nr:STP2 [Candida oxycetoniae]KAI3406031.2 STP2 [Candida oxycetoniae]